MSTYALPAPPAEGVGVIEVVVICGVRFHPYPHHVTPEKHQDTPLPFPAPYSSEYNTNIHIPIVGPCNPLSHQLFVGPCNPLPHQLLFIQYRGHNTILQSIGFIHAPSTRSISFAFENNTKVSSSVTGHQTYLSP